MKTLTFFIIALFLGITASAQTPQSFRYQAVARDNSGNILANQAVSFRISILSGSVTGTAVYSETHTSITNSFGLVELEIGKGTPVSGTFSAIDWGSSSYFVKVEMDPEGGSSYQVLSTSQLLSVPYAFYAGNGTQWAPSGTNIYYNSGKVGIGTGSPAHPLHIATTGNNGIFSETSAPEGHGLTGLASSVTGKNVGLKGESASSEGVGVIGNSPFMGVAGESTSPGGLGLFGLASSTTGTTTGIMGTAMSSDGKGVIGSADYPAGNTYGVVGHSASTAGTGVLGYNDASGGTTFGIQGMVTSPEGYSGYFTGGKFRVESQAVIDSILLMEDHPISNLANPVNPRDAATKEYVDAVALWIYSLLTAPVDETVRDASGNVYRTVKIGNQVWMAENLKTTKYNDGTGIPLVTDNTAWSNLTTPGYCWYNNDISNKNTYGTLYNWYAVKTGKLCPAGWHVPSDEEWAVLENYLIANGYNYDGTTSGNKFAKSMAATTNWISSTISGAIGNNLSLNNKSGFSGLPGGQRYYNGIFVDVGYFGSWWSSTEYSATLVWFRSLYCGHAYLIRYDYGKSIGFSVRCVRD